MLQGDTDAATHRRGSKVGQKEKPKEIEKLEKRLIEVGVLEGKSGMGIAHCSEEAYRGGCARGGSGMGIAHCSSMGGNEFL